MSDYIALYAKSNDMHEDDAVGYLADACRGGKIPNEIWYQETHRRLGLVSKFFKTKKEIMTLYDFLQTAKDVSDLESEAKTK